MVSSNGILLGLVSLASWLSLVATIITQEAKPDSLSGGAGWVGAGLLGLVLAWLLFVHLPTQSKDIKTMLEMHSAEREIERQSRHAARDGFNATLLGIQKDYMQAMKDIQQQHRIDAAADREAFMARNIRVEDAIRTQTIELKAAMASSCRWMHDPERRSVP